MCGRTGPAAAENVAAGKDTFPVPMRGDRDDGEEEEELPSSSSSSTGFGFFALLDFFLLPIRFPIVNCMAVCSVLFLETTMGEERVECVCVCWTLLPATHVAASWDVLLFGWNERADGVSRWVSLSPKCSVLDTHTHT
jgi:hypothetical protein